MLGGSSAGNARNWYCGEPKPLMSSASAGSPSRATLAEQESEGAVGPAVLAHADRVHALVEEVELAHGLPEVLDLLGERVELLLQLLDPIFDGMQAQYEHSPPTSSRSTRATRNPPSAKAPAQCSPGEPPPTTMTS